MAVECWSTAQGRLPVEAMQPGHRFLVVECSNRVAKPAEIVWQAVRQDPEIVFQERIREHKPPSEGGGLPNPARAAGRVLTAQRVTEIHDGLLLLRIELVAGQGLPWSWCQSRLLVEPVDVRCARITITCLAVSATDPWHVEEVLRDLLLVSLRTLKQRVEAA